MVGNYKLQVFTYKIESELEFTLAFNKKLNQILRSNVIINNVSFLVFECHAQNSEKRLVGYALGNIE